MGKDIESDPPASLQRHVAKGSAWSVGVRWASRLTGLVSTIILARLLTPADYGVVTIAMVVVATIEIFNQTGQNLAIIRHPDPTREHYDAAWTIFIILSTILATAMWIAAPLTQIYFHEPRADAVVKVLAFRTFIGGLENVGIVDFYRNLQFDRVFKYRTYPSLVSFVVGLVAAFALRNYWALVIGILSEQITRIGLSYILSPFRPRLSLRKVSELWSFSIWTFFRSIGAYFGAQIDKLAIGGFGGAAAMGRYEVAYDLATAPSAEINQPLISVLFPVMSKAQHDRAALRGLYLSVLYWSFLICFSSAAGIALVTSDFVDLILGPKWGDAKQLLPWLALAYGIGGPSYSTGSIFDAVGKPHISARLQWASVAICAAAIVAAAFVFKLVVAVAVARFVVTCMLTPMQFYFVTRELAVRMTDVASLSLRPLAASVTMAVVVFALQGVLHPGTLRLCIEVSVGAATYIGSILVFWQLIGAPSGPEEVIVRYARQYWDRLRRKSWTRVSGTSPEEM